jgi:hypothetical protein
VFGFVCKLAANDTRNASSGGLLFARPHPFPQVAEAESNPPSGISRCTGFEVRGPSCCRVSSGAFWCCQVQISGTVRAVWCCPVTAGDVRDVCNVFASEAGLTSDFCPRVARDGNLTIRLACQAGLKFPPQDRSGPIACSFPALVGSAGGALTECGPATVSRKRSSNACPDRGPTPSGSGRNRPPARPSRPVAAELLIQRTYETHLSPSGKDGMPRLHGRSPCPFLVELS